MRQLPLPEPGTPVVTSPGGFLWWVARRQWGILTVTICLGLVGFACQAAVPYLTGKAIDALSGGFSSVGPWLLWILGAGLIQVAASAMGHRYDVENWLRAAFVSSQLVGDTVARSGDAITAELPTGEVVSAVANDALRIGEIYAVIARFAGSVLAYVVVAIVMLRASVQMGLVVTVGVPLVAGCLALLVKPLQQRQTAQREAQGRLTTLGADTVAGLRILRGIGGEKVFADRYRAQSQAVRAAGVKVATPHSYLEGLRSLLPGLFFVLVLFMGAHSALRGDITTGQLVSFCGYATFLAYPLQMTVETIRSVTRAHVAAKKIIKVLRIVPAAGATPAQASLPAPGADLVDETTGVTVPAGKVVALVCQDPDFSAAVATRMGRFDDAAESHTPVHLGGVRLADVDKAELRDRVVVTEANGHLFSGVLGEELDVRGRAVEKQLMAALMVADAQDALDSTPDGINGTLAEKGRSLSGGQRQRLMLARAILTEPEILILIEPTSAVDAHTEARIAARLADARKGRSTLIVTASPLVLEHVDEIQVLGEHTPDGHTGAQVTNGQAHAGRVVATGTHLELLERPGAAGAYYRSVVGRDMHDDAAPVGDAVTNGDVAAPNGAAHRRTTHDDGTLEAAMEGGCR